MRRKLLVDWRIIFLVGVAVASYQPACYADGYALYQSQLTAGMAQLGSEESDSSQMKNLLETTQVDSNPAGWVFLSFGASGCLISICLASGCGVSVCFGSGCLGSVCPGSGCAGSGCTGSLCAGSGCVASACGTSLCAGSVCAGSACLGSGCAGSACLGSVCGGSVCAASGCGISVCGGSGCALSTCGFSACGGSACVTSGCGITSTCLLSNCENCGDVAQLNTPTFIESEITKGTRVVGASLNQSNMKLAVTKGGKYKIKYLDKLGEEKTVSVNLSAGRYADVPLPQVNRVINVVAI